MLGSCWLVNLLGVLGGLLYIVEVVQDNSYGFYRLVELLIDAKSLIVKTVLRVFGKLCELVAVVLV